MHIGSLVKIPCYLLKLSSGNENMGVSRADLREKLTKFAHEQSQTRSLQYQCTYQVWSKSIDVYSSYHPETKNGRTDVRRTDGQTDGLMDDPRETIIPPATIVWRGIKKEKKGEPYFLSYPNYLPV